MNSMRHWHFDGEIRFFAEPRLRVSIPVTC